MYILLCFSLFITILTQKKIDYFMLKLKPKKAHTVKDSGTTHHPLKPDSSEIM